MKINNKATVVGAIMTALGVICLAIKAIIPVVLDAQGFLHEPFFLLPVGFGLFFAGVFAMAIGFVTWDYHMRHQTQAE